MMSSGFVLCAVIFLSQTRSVTVTQFGMYTKLCFDDQRSEHSFVADRSDINLVDNGNNATPVVVNLSRIRQNLNVKSS